MALPGKNADLFRRFRLYGFGILLGMLTVKVMYKGKGCQMPSSAKLEELDWQKLEVTSTANCRMKCLNVTVNEVRQVLKSGKVIFDKSEVHQKPYPMYEIEGVTATGKRLELNITDCDTISQLITLKDITSKVDTCQCK